MTGSDPERARTPAARLSKPPGCGTLLSDRLLVWQTHHRDRTSVMSGTA
ncbi:MAG TPA: hypothetical protein VF635_07890 [Propionibacteriaceae bacterium]